MGSGIMGIRVLRSIMVSWVFALDDMEFVDGGGRFMLEAEQ
jgi:hypothetical protein